MIYKTVQEQWNSVSGTGSVPRKGCEYTLMLSYFLSPILSEALPPSNLPANTTIHILNPETECSLNVTHVLYLLPQPVRQEHGSNAVFFGDTEQGFKDI